MTVMTRFDIVSNDENYVVFLFSEHLIKLDNKLEVPVH